MRHILALLMLFSIFLVTSCEVQENTEKANEKQAGEEEDSNHDTEGTIGNFIEIENQETLATDLEIPWNIIKHGDIFFITERLGNIAVIANGNVHRETLHLNNNVNHHGEGGLLGMVLHPDFDDNKLAYIYYTYVENNDLYNRIALVQRIDNEWHEKKSILHGIRGSQFHNGGRIKIGPDGYLYVTTGDVHKDGLAQDQDEMIGSILRMDLDGGIPEDNPSSNSYIYSYGHRNPQGLTWSKDGELYSSEHGPSGFDEINLIEPGMNYGWPVIKGDDEDEGMETPLFHSGSLTWAPSGMFYHEGVLYVAGLRGTQIIGFDLENISYDSIFSDVGRIRDVYIEENRLYLITNNTDGRGTPTAEDDRLIVLTFK